MFHLFFPSDVTIELSRNSEPTSPGAISQWILSHTFCAMVLRLRTNLVRIWFSSHDYLHGQNHRTARGLSGHFIYCPNSIRRTDLWCQTNEASESTATLPMEFCWDCCRFLHKRKVSPEAQELHANRFEGCLCHITNLFRNSHPPVPCHYYIPCQYELKY